MKSLIVMKDQPGRKCKACKDEPALIIGAGQIGTNQLDAGELHLCSECFEALAGLFDEFMACGFDRKEYHGV